MELIRVKSKNILSKKQIQIILYPLKIRAASYKDIELSVYHKCVSYVDRINCILLF